MIIKIINVLQESNKDDIYNVVKTYTNNLPQNFISDNEFTIEICDHDIPTLDLYDLPGIRLRPQNMVDLITKLYEKYLSDQNSIVLCVVPAITPRLSSCQCISIISNMEMESQCILVLTMADRLQDDTVQELLIDRIIGESDEMEDFSTYGCVAVINRLHNDVHTLKDHDEYEKQWFTNNITSSIPDNYLSHESTIVNNVTIKNLLNHIDQYCNNVIKTQWRPRINDRIQEKIDILDDELSYYSCGPCDHEQINKFLSNAVRNMFDANIDIDENDNNYKFKFFNDIFTNSPNSPNSSNPTQNVLYLDNFENEYSYHTVIKEIDIITTEYMKCDATVFDGYIDDIFDDTHIKTSYKLNRFEKVKHKIMEQIKHNFNCLLIENVPKINEIAKKKILDKYLNGDYCDSVPIDTLSQMFVLFIIYPLLSSLKFDFTDDDYVESDYFVQERIRLTVQIKKLTDCMSLINEL